jgi:hypothetical protein
MTGRISRGHCVDDWHILAWLLYQGPAAGNPLTTTLSSLSDST